MAAQDVSAFLQTARSGAAKAGQADETEFCDLPGVTGPVVGLELIARAAAVAAAGTALDPARAGQTDSAAADACAKFCHRAVWVDEGAGWAGRQNQGAGVDVARSAESDTAGTVIQDCCEDSAADEAVVMTLDDETGIAEADRMAVMDGIPGIAEAAPYQVAAWIFEVVAVD